MPQYIRIVVSLSILITLIFAPATPRAVNLLPVAHAAIGLPYSDISSTITDYSPSDGEQHSTGQPKFVPTFTGYSVTAITTGGGHTCALTSNSGVKCWGSNNFTQLGDGTTTPHSTPVDVVGLTSGVIQISGGWWHTCALKDNGAVKCWGANGAGAAGDGSLTGGIVQVAAGNDHSCALTNGGGVKCWGANYSGQLGDGTTTDSIHPVDVSGLISGVVGIATHTNQTCAWTDALHGSIVKCWGSGPIGDGTTDQQNAPVTVPNLTQITAMAMGWGHTCALTNSGGVKCWGDNNYGQLGDGTTATHLTPTDVNGLTNGVAAIAAGGNITCALTTNGGVKCWGNNFVSGDTTGSQIDNRLVPTDMLGLTSGVMAIAVDWEHACALTTSGGVKCWGDNHIGQLGDGTVIYNRSPVDVAGLNNNVVTLTAGSGGLVGGHTCALNTGGGVKCWGFNGSGELGNGINADSSTPVGVSGLSSNVTAIEAGNTYACALLTTGGVKCWGSNNWGELGDGTTQPHPTPIDVSGLTSGATAIAAGSAHTCAVTIVGGVKCWGANGAGQLGTGTNQDQLVPTDVSGPLGVSGAITITAGSSHTCAVAVGGAALCWGDNTWGQLGDGTTLGHTTPITVTGLVSGVVAITAGLNHTCAQLTNGGVQCWGRNDFGQLGDGMTVANSLLPVAVVGLGSNITAIAAGLRHTCALTDVGGVKCWGANDKGQLGDGTTDSLGVYNGKNAPVDVRGMSNGVSAIAAGGWHSCAVIADGAKCWGNNSWGQLGDGRLYQSLLSLNIVHLLSVVAESGLNNIRLNWNPINIPEVTTYQISRAISNTALVFLPVASISTTTFFDSDPSLIKGTTYCYQIEAMRADGGMVITSAPACAMLGQVELWMPDIWAAPGITTFVPINIRNAQGLRLAAADIWLDYDDAVLEPVTISNTALTHGYTWSYTITSGTTYSRTQISVTSPTSPTLYGEGSLFWLGVQIKGTSGMTSTLDLREYITATGGSTLYTVDDLVNHIPLKMLDSVFFITNAPQVLGDLNGDGLVQDVDADIALQIASGQITPTSEQRQAGDVNGDGAIDAADATMIRYFAVYNTWPPAGITGQQFRIIDAVVNPVLSLDNVSGLSGATVTTTLRAEGLSEWAGGQFAIAYSSLYVASVESITPTGLASGSSLRFYDTGTGLARLALAAASPISGTGALANIVLRLSPGAYANTSGTFTLAEGKMNDIRGRDFATSALQRQVIMQNGQVKILSLLYLPLVSR